MITRTDIKNTVTWSQIGLVFFKWVHTCFLIAWALVAMIGGFCEGILHIPPIAWEILLISILSDCLGFMIEVTPGTNLYIPADVNFKVKVIAWTIFVEFVGIALNITHLVFTSIELAQCTSMLCENTYWFLVIFDIVLGLLVIIEVCEVVFLFKYKYHVGLLQNDLAGAGKAKSF